MVKVVVCGLRIAVAMFFRCRFCPCVFCSQADLDLHLRAFGDNSHIRAWRCIRILASVTGYESGVDDHAEGNYGRIPFYHLNTVRACREFLCIR